MRYKNFVVFTALALPALTHLSAVAQTCPDNVPHVTGTWTVLPYQMPINPISANLLPNGKVMIVAGSETDANNNSEGAESYRAAVWDPSGSDESSISVHNLTYDVFCSGTAALFDGRSLIVGGTAVASVYNSEGENRASIFNPVTNQFVQCQNMVDGRWYGTATELADGRIMAMSGLTQTGPTSRTIEIYDLQRAGAGWNPPTSVPFTPPLFPRLELLPGGRVFYTGHGTSTSNCKCMDLRSGHGRLDAISHNHSQPQVRLISSASSSAAQLRSPGDEFRGRSCKSSDLFYRHHRPLRCNPELHRRPQYVHRSHRDERRYPAQRQGLGGGWFPQQRSSRHAG